MLTLWGRLSSINVRKVVWAAQEAQASFTRHDAGGAFGIVRTPDFLQLNPNGLVPVLQDGATVLWESNVIVRYLAVRFPLQGLMPDDLVARFRAEQWMDWQQSTLNPAGRDAFIQWIRTPQQERKHAVLQQSVAATEPLMALLDRHLAQHDYMLGERFTVADIPLACEVHRWFGLPQPRPAWPHLERWFSALCARPASRGVLDQTLS
jgi:glutathione S-transferase